MRLLVLTFAIAACRGSTPAASPPDGHPDATASAPDSIPGAPDAPYQDDGAPTRVPCTNQLGNALTEDHGRLDGYLVSIVPTTEHDCNGDDEHVHLQVRANGEVYDVAVNIEDPADVDYLAKAMPLPDGAWVEGWHPDQAALLDYPTLGFHDTDFTPTPEATLESAVDTELADVNHISVFMTGYGADGGHLVHRNGSGTDGAIVTQPLGASRVLMFHFSDQTF